MSSALRTFILFGPFSAICGTQAEHASITGTVTDSSGAPIIGGFPRHTTGAMADAISWEDGAT